MNTGHRNLTALAVMLLLVNSLCGQVITLLHQGQSSFYYLPGTTLEDVVGLYAQDNDTIVLPGGPIDLDQTGDLFVTKPLVFIGAGVYPSATGVTNRTQIIGNSLDRFTVQAGGSGSEFHGIEFYSTPPDITNNNVTDLLFKHCEFTICGRSRHRRNTERQSDGETENQTSGMFCLHCYLLHESSAWIVDGGASSAKCLGNIVRSVSSATLSAASRL